MMKRNNALNGLESSAWGARSRVPDKVDQEELLE